MGIYFYIKHFQSVEFELICISPFTDPARKIDFNMRLAMVCDATWVQFPTHFNLMHMSRAFAIRVDATSLSEGAHLTRYFLIRSIINFILAYKKFKKMKISIHSIRAFDVTNVDKGPIFRIPITVVQPSSISKMSPLPDLTFNNVQFKPNTIRRHFILVPDDATWAGENSFSFYSAIIQLNFQ